MERISDEDLAALEKLCAEATPGPWVRRLSAYVTSEHDDRKIADTETYMRTREKQDANADFISAARTALPALLEEVRRARAEGARAEALLTLYRVKLAVDGLNRRCWDASTHLSAVEAIAVHDKALPVDGYDSVLILRDMIGCALDILADPAAAAAKAAKEPAP